MSDVSLNLQEALQIVYQSKCTAAVVRRFSKLDLYLSSTLIDAAHLIDLLATSIIVLLIYTYSVNSDYLVLREMTKVAKGGHEIMGYKKSVPIN